MSDREIREAERAHAADPSDTVALEALAAARTRTGQGVCELGIATVKSRVPIPLDPMVERLQRKALAGQIGDLTFSVMSFNEGDTASVLAIVNDLARVTVFLSGWMGFKSVRIPTLEEMGGGDDVDERKLYLAIELQRVRRRRARWGTLHRKLLRAHDDSSVASLDVNGYERVPKVKT